MHTAIPGTITITINIKLAYISFIEQQCNKTIIEKLKIDLVDITLKLCQNRLNPF